MSLSIAAYYDHHISTSVSHSSPHPPMVAPILSNAPKQNHLTPKLPIKEKFVFLPTSKFRTLFLASFAQNDDFVDDTDGDDDVRLLTGGGQKFFIK